VAAPVKATGNARPFFDAGFISYTAASERRLVDVARTEQLEEN
jgi:hypothetical protein